MYRKIVLGLAILAMSVLAGCGAPHYPPDSDGMLDHHVSFQGI